MQTEEMIPATEFCIHHNIELSFIYALQQSGLIEIAQVEENIYLPISQLREIEKLACFYYEMDINLEGLETINHLLQKISYLQQQITVLTHNISRYENE
jgi:chaperone modulatory protein CbpM